MEKKQIMSRRTSSKELHLISCGYEQCSADDSYGPVMRPYYIVHFVLSGKGHFLVGSKHYTIEQEQFFLIEPNVLTFYKADSQNPWNYAWICFNGTKVSEILSHCGINRDNPVKHYSGIQKFKVLIMDMMKYYEWTPAGEYYIQSNLYKIFALLGEASNSSYQVSESVDNYYITQAADYILSGFAPDITVMDLADYLHISRSYLFSLFKKNLNLSPQQFLIMTRITSARELLANTELPVAAVANSCGYQNPFAFSRAFKKEMGISPKEYRMKYRNIQEIIDY